MAGYVEIELPLELLKAADIKRIRAVQKFAKTLEVPEVLNLVHKAAKGERITAPHLNPHIWQLEKEFFDLWEPKAIIKEISIRTGITKSIKKSLNLFKGKAVQFNGGKPIYNSEGKPLTDEEVAFLEKVIAEALKLDRKKVRALITKSALVSKLSGKVALDKPIPVDLKALPSELKAAIKTAGLSTREVRSILWAYQYAAANIKHVQEQAAHEIKMHILNGIMERRSNRQMADSLMEDMAVSDNSVLNRDWERVAITEMNRSASDGFIAGMRDGEYVVGNSHPDACQYCMRHIHMKVYKVTTSPPEFYGKYKPGSKKYEALARRWETEVWVGKSNYGRSFAKRKQQAGKLVERDHHELGMPTLPLHPYCRCRWTEWLPEIYYIKNGDIEYAYDEKTKKEQAEWLKKNPHIDFIQEGQE